MPPSVRTRPAAPPPAVATPPKQERSQALLDQMTRACTALLAERAFEDITMSDLARAAGVSVGVFYTRFATKEHVLAHLARDLSQSMYARLEADLSPSHAAGLSLRGVAECYFGVAAEMFVAHRAVLRPLTLIVRQAPRADLRAVTASFNERAHGLLRTRLLEHRHEIRHRAPGKAVDFAILSASAALRELLLYHEPVSRLGGAPGRAAPKRAARDAANLCVAYLTSAPTD